MNYYIGALFPGRAVVTSSRRSLVFCRVALFGHSVALPRLMDDSGKLTPSMHTLIMHGDPEIVCHSCPAFAADLLWARMCGLAFVGTKLWFILTLANFIVGLQYGILMSDDAGASRWALIGCRAPWTVQVKSSKAVKTGLA